MNIQMLMKQAQKMQQELTKKEAELKGRHYEGRAADGQVVVDIKGDLKITKIDIADELIAENDKDLMGDLIALAVNEAIEKAVTEKNAVMNDLTGGVKVPGMF